MEADGKWREAGEKEHKGGAGKRWDGAAWSPWTRGRRGNRDQFCQNWVHTPGAAELGWPAESVRAGGEGRWGSTLLFISFCSGLKKIYVSACVRSLWPSVHVEVLNRHICAHKSVNKSGVQSLKGRTRGEQNILLSLRGRVIHPRETKTGRQSEVTPPCPQHRGKSATPRLIKHWKWDQEAFPFRLINQSKRFFKTVQHLSQSAE